MSCACLVIADAGSEYGLIICSVPLFVCKVMVWNLPSGSAIEWYALVVFIILLLINVSSPPLYPIL